MDGKLYEQKIYEQIHRFRCKNRGHIPKVIILNDNDLYDYKRYLDGTIFNFMPHRELRFMGIKIRGSAEIKPNEIEIY